MNFNFISRFIDGRKLNKEQRKIDKLYEKDGLTDEVLNRQIALNQLRHEMDIPDPKQRIYKKWVQ